ncbi:MAG: hypothetical protein US63_C0006G0006 [Candidatus Moranbacteria bacterium GW2011_GWC2_37_8]|nr:MAG: hypothetical protein US63_C0006G0006 [Candidatus Moranbacteria bacterium GW2011_GWC2_37_8]KKQ62432.1 MAG: hypothetical protein US82_C0011G0006 [Parcubacteria group bacterium GW2011_GWC1_38_22]KKQ80290.1 MAG: hypothetical protein UT03_C0028G0006 [Candidatus Moranbacteria bacterium GW2011_GWD2_38_7]
MNIIQAMKQVGHFPITQGFWKNVMITMGLIGSAVMLAVIIIGGLGNWLTFSLLIFFIIMNTLGLYIPFDYVYCCRDAKSDIDFHFSHPWQSEKGEPPEELFRALHHMTKGTTLERHNVSCQKCWDYHEAMKRKHCGG